MIVLLIKTIIFIIMLNRIMTLFVFVIIFLLIDFYVFQAVINVSKDWSLLWKQLIRYGFWVPTLISISGLLWWTFSDPYKGTDYLRIYILAGSAILYFSKLFAVLFLFVDDLQRGVRWVAKYFSKTPDKLPGEVITRSEFLSKAAL